MNCMNHKGLPVAAAVLGLALLTSCGVAKDSPKQENGTVGTSTVVSDPQIQYTGGLNPSASVDVYAMDTYMSITGYGTECREAVKAAAEEIHRLDRLLSVGNADSEISRINESGSGTVSADTADMLGEALELYRTTGGAFDITVYPLMEKWGFTSGEFKVPSDQEIRTLLQTMGSDKLKFSADNGAITLGPEQGIDLGGIAKGFTSSRLMEIFSEHGLTSGIVNLGGNVQCYKTKPDGGLWRCGIVDPNAPDDANRYLGIISLQDKALITSGAYERNFIDEETGKSYHHIIDPATGYPADHGLISASIVSANGTLADGLSTSCYVMGLDRSIAYWKKYGDDFDMILMTTDNELYVTAGIADQFTSDYKVHVVDR